MRQIFTEAGYDLNRGIAFTRLRADNQLRETFKKTADIPRGEVFEFVMSILEVNMVKDKEKDVSLVEQAVKIGIDGPINDPKNEDLREGSRKAAKMLNLKVAMKWWDDNVSADKKDKGGRF